MTRSSLLFCVAGITVFAAGAFAQNNPLDPDLYQDGSHCAGSFWCASAVDAVDPNTQQTTLQFIMNNIVPPGYQGISVPWITGWVADETSNGAIADLLDFTTATINNVMEDIVYLYCNPLYDKCSSLDSGLPTTPPTISAHFTMGTPYIPTGNQPGTATAQIGKATGPAAFSVLSGTTVATPEPSAVLLLSGMLLAVGIIARRKISAQA